METQNNIIFGIYVMGIPKRPELANKPCVITCSDDNQKLILAITFDDKVENISFDISKILGARNVVRTIMSQAEFKDTSPNSYNVQLLANAVAGPTGVLVAQLIGSSNLLNSSNSGQVNYTSLNEVHITYVNDSGEQRELLIQTDLDPTKFIKKIYLK